ncbi:MAG: hypothetical protein OEY29_14455 [Gammaproteobacteria bacterium]|nr:hypothetical protein [Gammaproteobacteria bacterium]
MANADRPNGLRPVKLLSGSPYNGQMTKFYTDTDCFLGDIMIQDTASVTGGSDGAYQGITRATSATATLAIGVVVGWEADPDNLTRPYHAGSSTLCVYVATDPNIIYECQGDGTATITTAADVGLNFDIVVTAGNTTTGLSNMEVLEGSGAVTAATPVKLVGLVDRADNEVGLANQKMLVTLNTHVYNADVGSLGV